MLLPPHLFQVFVGSHSWKFRKLNTYSQTNLESLSPSNILFNIVTIQNEIERASSRDTTAFYAQCLSWLPYILYLSYGFFTYFSTTALSKTTQQIFLTFLVLVMETSKPVVTPHQDMPPSGGYPKVDRNCISSSLFIDWILLVKLFTRNRPSRSAWLVYMARCMLCYRVWILSGFSAKDFISILPHLSFLFSFFLSRLVERIEKIVITIRSNAKQEWLFYHI